jgi:hypothetical protein
MTPFSVNSIDTIKCNFVEHIVKLRIFNILCRSSNPNRSADQLPIPKIPRPVGAFSQISLEVQNFGVPLFCAESFPR